MFSYNSYGLSICSDLPLPELRPAEHEADVVIRIGMVGYHSDEFGRIKCLQATPDQAYLSWGRIATALVQHGREIIVDPFPDVDERVLRLLILGVALGVLLHQRGLLVLHASAVAINGNVIAFIGRKGWGKSTTAAMLHRRGHTIVTDDILALENTDGRDPLVFPSFPQFKLWPDAVAAMGNNPEILPRLHPQVEKRAYQVSDGFASTSLPLKRIFVLDGGPTLELEPVQPQEAFLELVSHSYAPRFLGNSGITPQHFHQCARLANGLPIYRLKRHNSLAALPEIARLIEENLSRDLE